MGRLTLVLTILPLSGLACAAPAHAGQVERWTGHIAEASARFGIPEAWIRRVMAAESGGRTILHGRPIESHAGAMGLMQLMPQTWQAMRAANGLGADPHDPRDNVLAGAAYLRLMYERFGYPGLFGAYNAGPGAYPAWLGGRRRLPAETSVYMAQVAGGAAADRGSPPAARTAVAMRVLFAIRTVAAEAPSVAAAEPVAPSRGPGRGMFVPLRSGRP